MTLHCTQGDRSLRFECWLLTGMVSAWEKARRKSA